MESLMPKLPRRDGPYEHAWAHCLNDFGFSKKFINDFPHDIHLYNQSISNLIRVFGDSWMAKWTTLTEARIHRWKFNTISCSPPWIPRNHIKMPYCIILHNFPKTSKKIFRDFPDVFSYEYARNSDIYAQGIDTYIDESALIGYFMSNEPEWAFIPDLNIAEELLRSPQSFDSKKVMINFLEDKYRGSIEDFNNSWDLNLNDFNDLNQSLNPEYTLTQGAREDTGDFSQVMIERYVGIPAEAVRRHDPNHLNLGMRYAFISSMDMLGGAKHFDIFSINCYKINALPQIRTAFELTGKPVIIGEFHFGALDRGLPTTGLRGVSSQKQRGVAYRFYMEQAASHKAFLGAHYFILNDQPYLGRFDGENYQIGLVDICHRPYEEMVSAVTETNSRIYAVANGDVEPFDKVPDEIPTNAM
jgi:hypothetical protein